MSQIDYKERMRRSVALLVAAACLLPRAAGAQEIYASVLLDYLGGDPDAALRRLVVLDRQEVLAGVTAFNTTRARQILTGAAAMHTEAALRAAFAGGSNAFHLEVATALVEFGEEPKLKSNTPIVIHPKEAVPVSANFRKLWYGLVITVLQSGVRMSLAERYLGHALALFRGDPEIQLLAGIDQEMRASPRAASMSGGDERKFLDGAERHYRAALGGAPDRLETRLRLGRVLLQRHQLGEARTLLEPLTSETR